ncbi:uncharacterized protein O3C94_015674 [Discoglossus pictus]
MNNEQNTTSLLQHRNKRLMNKDKNKKVKMFEKILDHIQEIIYLLTGEHLTNSIITTEMRKNRKVTERMLNHTLQIIYLLTGEEYTIVKKNPPHSHHLSEEVSAAGQCDIITNNKA